MQFGIGNNSSNMSISSKENAFEIIIFLSSTSLWVIRGVYEKLLSSNIYQKKKNLKIVSETASGTRSKRRKTRNEGFVKHLISYPFTPIRKCNYLPTTLLYYILQIRPFSEPITHS